MKYAGIRSGRKSDQGSVGHVKNLKVYPKASGKLIKKCKAGLRWHDLVCVLKTSLCSMKCWVEGDQGN